MKIIDYFESENRAELVEKIAACDWSAAKFLAELLTKGTFDEMLGGWGHVYLLIEGEKLVSFLTLSGQDAVRDENLTPWIGFVYTVPAYRGHRYAGRLLAYAEQKAAELGCEKLHIGTDHVGLYEKYGYTYQENRIDCWGGDMRVLTKRIGGKNMRTIKSMEEKYLLPALELVQTVFTESECEENGLLVRRLVEEIRSKRWYLPELELVMVDEQDEIIGYVNFSRFHLGGKFEDELLLLSPVAVKTRLQRQHISKDLIEYGLQKARDLGYKAVIVEGNPMNYRSRGFRTSADFGITAHESVGLPAPECLMVQELIPGGLEGISGQVCYSDYECLR
jgi:predicted N-acetyltransferase YhbS